MFSSARFLPISLVLVAGITSALGGSPAASAQDADKVQDAEKDRKLLQGPWEVVSMTQGGKPVPGQNEGKIVFTFAGDKISVKVGNKTLNEGTFKLDAGQMPRAIDLKDKSDVVLGIYELKENELRLCMGVRGKTRPAEFVSGPGMGQSLITLKRVK